MTGESHQVKGQGLEAEGQGQEREGQCQKKNLPVLLIKSTKECILEVKDQHQRGEGQDQNTEIIWISKMKPHNPEYQVLVGSQGQGLETKDQNLKKEGQYQDIEVQNQEEKNSDMGKAITMTRLLYSKEGGQEVESE